MVKLNSGSYQNALLVKKNPKYELSRTSKLLTKILTRIEKIHLDLRNEEIPDKELKTKLNLLTQLFGLKKLLRSEIKELEGNLRKEPSSLSDILS